MNTIEKLRGALQRYDDAVKSVSQHEKHLKHAEHEVEQSESEVCRVTAALGKRGTPIIFNGRSYTVLIEGPDGPDKLRIEEFEALILE